MASGTETSNCWRKQYGNHMKQQQRRSSMIFRLSSLLVVLALMSLITTASASGSYGDRRAAGSRRARSAPLPAVLVDNSPLASTLPSELVDTRSPSMAPLNDEEATRTISAPPSKRSISTAKPTSSGFQLPKPFDSALSNNFTSGCTDFFTRMLASETINTCHPFSLLLQTSAGLFDISQSFVRITQTLEATCSVNSVQCLGGMNALARELMSNAACKTDYDNNNAQVVQAYNGLIAYEPLYRASCLRDDDGNFCYANAVTNRTSAGADANPYYLPLGVSLPGVRPTCNQCLQDAMAIFSTFAGNSSQPLSQTYTSAAQQVIIYCGANFVNVTAAPLKGAAASTTVTFAPTITLFIMVFFYLFQ